MTRPAPFALALALALAGAPAAAEQCALELILAVDVSGSIDDREFALQMEGMASAFEDPQVIEAVGAQKGGVLVAMTEWSGASRQRQVTEWHLLRDAGSMAAFARDVRESGRDWRNYSTAIGEGLYHALKVGETAPQDCRRRVIDVSGDGVNNEGRPPRAMADALAAIGYTVNALVIRGDVPDPVSHYEVNVLAGPRAFMEIAADFEDYGRAIRRKLLREIEEQALVARTEEDASPGDASPRRFLPSRKGRPSRGWPASVWTIRRPGQERRAETRRSSARYQSKYGSS